jgi:hypothetical protein
MTTTCLSTSCLPTSCLPTSLREFNIPSEPKDGDVQLHFKINEGDFQDNDTSLSFGHLFIPDIEIYRSSPATSGLPETDFPLCPNSEKEWKPLVYPKDPQTERWTPGVQSQSENSFNRMGLLLVSAIQEGNISKVQLLLKYRLNLDIQNTNGENALLSAIQIQHPGLIEFLLREGVSVDCSNDEGFTPLHFACMQNDPMLVKLLLARNPNVNARLKLTQDTPLHYAAMSGNVEIARMLLDHKDIDTTAVNKTGYTPMHYAANNEYMLQLFTEHSEREKRIASSFTPFFSGGGSQSTLDKYGFGPRCSDRLRSRHRQHSPPIDVPGNVHDEMYIWSSSEDVEEVEEAEEMEDMWVQDGEDDDMWMEMDSGIESYSDASDDASSVVFWKMDHENSE